jgi:hypothetical protein
MSVWAQHWLTMPDHGLGLDWVDCKFSAIAGSQRKNGHPLWEYVVLTWSLRVLQDYNSTLQQQEGIFWAFVVLLLACLLSFRSIALSRTCLERHSSCN